MSSTRLPGKILATLGNSTILGSVVGAARSATLVDEVIVATSTDATDDETQEACRSLNVECVRGSLQDVVSRYKLAIRGRGADAIVRLTADCPLLDPRLVDVGVKTWLRDPTVALVTNGLIPSYPRGFDVEVLSRNALDWLDLNSRGYHRTHVTSLLTESPGPHRVLNVTSDVDNSDLRLTVDTREDFVLVRAVVQELGIEAQNYQRVVELLRSRPDLVLINRDVQQKKIEEG